MKTPQKTKLAIFASGSGSNAQQIFDYFSKNNQIEVALIVTNNPKAAVIERFRKTEVPVLLINKKCLANEKLYERLQGIDRIILAGFLLLVPKWLILKFPQKIVNIHPSLLPKFGGKGMYGEHVHKAVLEAKEKETGITVHLVNEEYDKGEILAQFSCKLNSDDTILSVQQKIHQLEKAHFPKVIEKWINELIKAD